MDQQEQPSLKLSDQSLSDYKITNTYKVQVESLTVFAPRKSPLSLFASRLSRKTQIYHSKALLKNVSLECAPGELLAIIGASGSGKTTLLNSIAGRTSNMQIKEGEVKLLGSNDSPVGNSVAFVRQEDYLLPNLTVIETINFYASLKLPYTLKKESRNKIVDRVLFELDLTGIRNSRVGTLSGNGISGGERRRLSIACALVTMPSVLILDEPTTGLDSYTASSVVKTLSKLANRGRSIIMSIHQPPSGAFDLIDKICLMSFGKVMYSGPRDECFPWFSYLGHKAPDHTNPFDFLIDLSSVDTRGENEEERTKLLNYSLLEAWKKKAELDRTNIPSAVEHQLRTFQCSSIKGYKQPLLRQFSVLTQRSMLNVARNRYQIVAYAVQALSIGIIIGFTFYKPPETPAGVQTLKTLCYSQFFVYFYISFIFFAWIYSQELLVFDRERDDNLYSVGPYLSSQLVSYFPTNVFFPTIYSLIIYYMGGFRTDNLGRHLGLLIGVNVMMQVSLQVYSFCALCINRNFARAFSFSNAFASTYLITAGYLLINIPVYVKWMRWINPYYYGFNWLIRDQFEGRQFSCIGVTGALASQCQGHNVLVGLNLQLTTPMYVLPLGLAGYIVCALLVSYLLLRFYRPGGQKAATVQEQTAPLTEQEEALKVEAKRVCVNVKLSKVNLSVVTNSFDKSILRLRRRRIEKTVLKNVNAEFKAGEISAILGPSGAGKSSLLRLMADNVKSGPLTSFITSGDILLNNRVVKSNYYRKLISFCEQGDDWHMPALTVRETLKYAALLRLRHMSTQERLSRAEELIRAMGLKNVADTLVGNHLLKGISGGEKRRLSIAVALLDDPSVVILDEPTSGLDAYTATSVMECLQRIADTGVTVICSIHSPRSEIWKKFDNVTLMGKGGRLLFTGNKEACLESLSERGIPCPPDWNPADHALHAIFLKLGIKEDRRESIDSVAQLMQSWRASVLSFQSDSGRELPRWESQSKIQEWFTTLKTLIARSVKNIFRQKDVIVSRVMNTIILGFVGWIFFLRLGNGPSGVQNRIGVLQQNNAILMSGLVSAMTVYPGERNIFVREYRSAAKRSPIIFILSYTLVEIPTEIISCVIYTIIYMYGYGLQHSTRKFFELAVINFCVLNAGESMGMAINNWIPDGGLYVSLCASIYGIFGQISGIRSVTIPNWLKIIAWVAPLKSQTYLATINEFAGLTFNCSQGDIDSGRCVAANGDQILVAFGMSDHDTTKYLYVMIGLFVFYRLLAVLGKFANKSPYIMSSSSK